MVPIEKNFKFEKQFEARKHKDLGSTEGTSVIAGVPSEIGASGVILDPNRSQLTEEEHKRILAKTRIDKKRKDLEKLITDKSMAIDS